MLDLVKFTWRNRNGYWIPVSWMLVASHVDPRDAAIIGRPGMTQFLVLDREPIPEELRLQGRVSRLLANVILHDKQADSYSAREMLEAMLVATA